MSAAATPARTSSWPSRSPPFKNRAEAICGTLSFESAPGLAAMLTVGGAAAAREAARSIVRQWRLVVEWQLGHQLRAFSPRALDVDRAPEGLRAILQAE